MAGISRNSGVSKDLRSLISEFSGEDLDFDMAGGRVKITHRVKPFRISVSARPAPRDLKNIRARLLSVVKPDDAPPDVPEVPAEEAAFPYDDAASRGIEKADAPSPDDAAVPSDADNHETSQENDMTDMQADLSDAPIDADTVPDDAGISIQDPAFPDSWEDPAPAGRGAFDKLAELGPEEVSLIESIMRNGLPAGSMTVTADMLGCTLLVVDGHIVVAPEIVTRLAMLSSGQAPRQAAHRDDRAPVRRADAVSRRMGVISNTRGGSSAELTDALLEVFSQKPGVALRARDIYALLPQAIKSRYKGMESCSASFNKPLRGLIEQGLVSSGERVGREMTWISC